ncbi:hypothetical protein FEM48_Zijuj05G0168100 [Ziziphus jujuba var. spinosa]|uniref:Uncharacterized protein n=1 Tax=Ziziphus jujuba var. spinosa TaxID=714518 RepID=A0A978VFZ4_ZIZJJ|nr:hypothetical protein FEM48_Zijuj05G0168100 [Ziziphus jujuba var. spinosa]
MLKLPEQRTLNLNAKSIEKMNRLRLLIFNCNVVFSTAFPYLPNQLRLLHLPGYQFPTLLFDSVPKHLVILNMPGGHIQHLWKLTKSIENLKVMNFSHCQFLREILDLSTVPNLESLHLDHCTSLVEIYESVGSLTKLVSFPRIASEMEYLTSIDITGTPIKELPSKVELLVGVGEYEGITFSEKLILIPGNKYKLMHLELLDVSPFNNFDLDIPLAILDHEILLDLHLLREAIYNWDERYGRVELLDTVLRLSSM